MSRPARTTAELQQASEDLLYEIEMYGHTARLLHGNPWARSAYWIHKTYYFATIESFLTHARSLMDFLYGAKKAWKTDASVVDFVGHAWSPPPRWATYTDDKDRIGREIMHLSFDRPALKEGWNFGELAENINHALRAFLDEVDEKRVTTDFKERACAAMPNPYAGWTSVPTQTFQTATRLGERRSC